MKLRYSPTSPYVRKVMVSAIELGLRDRIELDTTNVWADDTTIRESNPLGKVPCLELEDGSALFDSPVICEYLDSLIPGVVLFPDVGDARWKALRFQALADGIMDAAVLRMKESMRDENEKSPDWMERQRVTMEAGLACIEKEVESLSGGPLTIGQISVACALSYLDLRYGDDNWQANCPELAKWHKSFLERPSMIETTPAS